MGSLREDGGAGGEMRGSEWGIIGVMEVRGGLKGVGMDIGGIDGQGRSGYEIKGGVGFSWG